LSDQDASLDAVLEEGWGHQGSGDFVAARKLAERVLREDCENPEALLLLAASLRGEGEPEKALAFLERASASADGWSTPEQWIAEILAQDLDRPSDALAHAEAALDRAEEDDEFFDAVVLKAGLEIELGRVKAAQATLSELPPPNEVELPRELAVELAYLFLDAHLTEDAMDRFQLLADSDAADAEARYGLGSCAEDSGNEEEKRKHWLVTFDLDAAADLQAPHMSEADMAEVAEQALKELPAAARERIENVPILVVDLPARQEVERGLDPRLLGLFEGVPYAEAGALQGTPELTRILLFRKNLERMAFDADDLRDQIRITLLHETGHFFGMSEQDLADVGLD
jgi:predicted Zn-dependent protease with MMP-like domain/thioredoxin-like negative regulator of GroEL